MKKLVFILFSALLYSNIGYSEYIDVKKKNKIS